MTFNIVVPSSNQSPGLFPTQNNTNFQRIKDIVNNDHNWTDSTSLSEGIHRQVTLISRNTPVGLPAGNGVLYSKPDSGGASQLRWYNGASDVQITPGVQVVVGSAVLGPLAVATMLTDPGYAYQAYYWLGVNGVTTASSGVSVHYSNNINSVTATQGSFSTVAYSGNNLTVRNNQTMGAPISFIWTLEIIRIG